MSSTSEVGCGLSLGQALGKVARRSGTEADFNLPEVSVCR